MLKKIVNECKKYNNKALKKGYIKTYAKTMINIE